MELNISSIMIINCNSNNNNNMLYAYIPITHHYNSSLARLNPPSIQLSNSKFYQLRTMAAAIISISIIIFIIPPSQSIEGQTKRVESLRVGHSSSAVSTILIFLPFPSTCQCGTKTTIKDAKDTTTTPPPPTTTTATAIPKIHSYSEIDEWISQTQNASSLCLRLQRLSVGQGLGKVLQSDELVRLESEHKPLLSCARMGKWKPI